MFKKQLGILLIIISLFFSSLAAYAQEVYSGKVNADKVLFRTKPNTDSDYIVKLKKNDIVSIIGQSKDFYKVKFNGKNGYVMKKFVSLSKNDEKKLNAPKSKYANIKSISKLGSMPAKSKLGSSGDSVEKLQRALQIKGFLSGSIDGKFGMQTKNAILSYQKKNKLKVNGEADENTLRHLWGKKLVSDSKNDPQMNGITKISQIPLPNTTKPGNSGRHVKSLQQALKLKGFYKLSIDSKYGQGTIEAVKAFQKAMRLEVDGVAGNGTIKKLFGKNALNYVKPIESIDWFKGGSTLIPKGAIFKVKDIASGKSFTAKRWSGYNHIDAEPLTAADTATLSSIYSGGWSWARRSVIVSYNGHDYAASINGMPHGEQTIKSNKFDGHFCMHLLNSKTHGTKRVDPEHQRRVNQAIHSRKTN